MKHLILTLLSLLTFISAGRAAEPKLDYSSFALLPVLHEGRIKPLDTYARTKLRDISGKENSEATAWLAESLFDPAAAGERKIFEIPNPEIREHLGLKKSPRYSLAELVPVLQSRTDEIAKLQTAEPATLTAQQNELLALHTKVRDYSELLRTFSAVLPLNLEVPKDLQTGKYENSYLDFAKINDNIQVRSVLLVKKKGPNPDKFTEEEKQLTALAFALQDISEGGKANDELKIIYDNGQWLSPWQFLLTGRAGSDAWIDMASAWRSGDAAKWLEATKKAHPPGSPDFRLKLERAYNATNPFELAMGFYALAIFILGAEIFRKTNRLLFPYICIAAGLALHIGGIAARIFILERAPVGTLYESLLFVSLICLIGALIIYFRRKTYTPFIIGAGSASALLFLAPFFIQQGDSLDMLVAVLNTNFWLGTHVLCITAGYGVSILTALLAHAWLILRLRGAEMNVLMPLQTLVYRVSLVALLLTTVGTILGGIWADQSWGRFWGWDPKENGALLIVLWLIWMQHGRVAGKLIGVPFMAAAAFLNVVVAVAWFGVNLLSVGLHSYGFITGIALALFLFCALETTIIGSLWILNKRNSNVSRA